MRADAIVNCTGPRSDLSHSPIRCSGPGRRLIAPDPLRLGIDVTPSGSVLGGDGRVVPGLFAVGPPRKGSLNKSTAIPEIRTQAAQIAAAVLGRVTAPVAAAYLPPTAAP